MLWQGYSQASLPHRLVNNLFRLLQVAQTKRREEAYKGGRNPQRCELSQQISFRFFSSAQFLELCLSRQGISFFPTALSPQDIFLFLQPQQDVTSPVHSLSHHEVQTIDALFSVTQKQYKSLSLKPESFQLPLLNLHKMSGMVVCKTIPDSWARLHL